MTLRQSEAETPPRRIRKLDWTELALQVQLYARAAEQVLCANAKTGSVHLLKDNQRVEVPIADIALDAAIANIEWAVRGILASDFPMRPHPEKCNACDFRSICPRTPQPFLELTEDPPELHLPGRTNRLAVQLVRTVPDNMADNLPESREAIACPASGERIRDRKSVYGLNCTGEGFVFASISRICLESQISFSQRRV